MVQCFHVPLNRRLQVVPTVTRSHLRTIVALGPLACCKDSITPAADRVRTLTRPNSTSGYFKRYTRLSLHRAPGLRKCPARPRRGNLGKVSPPHPLFQRERPASG